MLSVIISLLCLSFELNAQDAAKKTIWEIDPALERELKREAQEKNKRR